MSFLSRFVRVSYVFGLAVALSLLLRPSASQGQFRGSPGIPGLTNFMALTGVNIPNDGRLIGMLPPPMMLPLNNMMFGMQYMDSTGSPLAMMSAIGGGGGGMGMGGGMMGMTGGGGMMGMGGGGGGMMGMGGGMGGGGMMGMQGGMGGMGGGMTGMGGMSMMGMGGMSGGGMGGFAGKGMGGFNGRNAL